MLVIDILLQTQRKMFFLCLKDEKLHESIKLCFKDEQLHESIKGDPQMHI